jgi:hypothetical protein
MKIFFTFFLSALFAVNYSYGQIPANDLCANAQVISIPGSGSTCLTGTNAGATNAAITL